LHREDPRSRLELGLGGALPRPHRLSCLGLGVRLREL